ncbi:MAG: DUF1648 domain-containing protein [Planctomycetes bacterium]|nr:DUF1648 domain-containing protein [Planctomycetota bacterium]
MLRPAHLVLVVAMVAVWWTAASAWPELPARIPMHFDLSGRPDRWTTTSIWSWFGLPALATGIGLVFGFLLPWVATRLAAKHPTWINVIGRRRFQMLPAAARVRVVAAMMTWLVWLAVALQALMFELVRGTAAVATGAQATMPPVPLFVLLAVVLTIVAGVVVSQVRALRRETQRR